MEILQYLRRRPDALAILVLLPLLAGVLTYLLLQRQPPQYVGEARVIVPEQAATSASGVGLYIADFSVLVVSPETVDAVASATQVAPEEYRDNVEVNREGQSSLFTVTYTTTDMASAEPVLRTAITTTMTRMAPTSDADTRLEQTRAAFADAQNQLRAFQDQIGLLFPDREYNDLSSQIRSLQNSPVPADQALRQQLITRRDALVGQVRTYEELTTRLNQAANDLRDAEEASRSSDAARSDVQAGRPIQRITIAPAPTRQMVQAVGIGTALGLLGAIALVVAPDLLRGARRRPSPRPADEPERAEHGLRAADAVRGSETTRGLSQPADTGRARVAPTAEATESRAAHEPTGTRSA